MGRLSELPVPETRRHPDNSGWAQLLLGCFMVTVGYIGTLVGILGPLSGEFAYVICLFVAPYYFLFKGVQLLLLTATRLDE